LLLPIVHLSSSVADVNNMLYPQTNGTSLRKEGRMYRTIIVPLNGTTAAETAVPYAAEEARRHGAQLMLLQIIARPELVSRRVVRGGPLPSVYACSDEELLCIKQQARQYLRSVIERYEVNVDAVIAVAIGDPYLRLKAAVEQYPVPLVVATSTKPSPSHPSALDDAISGLILEGAAPILIVRQTWPLPLAMTSAVTPRFLEDPDVSEPQWQDVIPIDARLAGAV
jgi:nucleotide-binding universal stress UspA family protein